MPDEEQLTQLFRKWQEAHPPSSPEEICAQHPELLDRLKSMIADTHKALMDQDEDEDEADPALQLPQVDGYRMLRKLGAGGQGVVYLAMQLSTRRKVAVKFLEEGPESSIRARHRFEREIELVAGLRHPNIVNIFDSGRAPDGRLYYVMQYIRGESLTDYVRAHKEKMTLEKTLELFAQVCDAVNHAHEQGLTHRDLKPANVLVDSAGSPRLLDFGLAKRMSDPGQSMVSVTGVGLGTLAYMSPEQVSGDPDQVNMRSDVYALGVILYEMLTGTFPYPVVGSIAQVLQHISQSEAIPPSRSWTRENGTPSRGYRRGGCPIDDEVETIILKSLSKERERRYSMAGELAMDVRRYLRHEAIEAKRDSGIYHFKKFASRHRAAVGVLILFILMLAASTVLFAVLNSRARRAEQLAREATAKAERDRDDTAKLLRYLVASVAVNRNSDELVGGDLIADISPIIDLPNAPPEAVAPALVMRAIHNQEKEPQKALADYSTVIAMHGAPVQAVAIALMCRAATYSEQTHESLKAIADYSAAVQMDGAPVNVVAISLLSRGEIYRQQKDFKKAVLDYTAAINTPNAPPEHVAVSLLCRGKVYENEFNEPDKALADFNDVIKMTNAPPLQVAKAMVNRGQTYADQKQTQNAISDFTAVINMPGAPPEQVAMALNDRGVAARDLLHNPQRSIEDYTALLKMPDAPKDQISLALDNRGVAWHDLHELQKAMDDYGSAINTPGATPEQVAQALFNRAVTYTEMKDIKKALADFDTIINMHDVPQQVASALINRGVLWHDQNDVPRAIADYTAAIKMDDITPEQLARALNNRGITYGEQHELQKAIDDFNSVIKLAKPPELMADALTNRGAIWHEQNQTTKALDDFTAAINNPGASPDVIARALNNRGVTYGDQSDLPKAIDDFTAVINLPGAPSAQVAMALLSRSNASVAQHDPRKAMEDLDTILTMPNVPEDFKKEAEKARGTINPN